MGRWIANAQKRSRICPPVITSGPILGRLAEIAEHPGVDIAGVYDGTQMDEVQRQWATQPTATWKATAFHSIVAAIRFGAKRSTPYAKGTVHDFMHAKLLVADDYVYPGSFNLSPTAEINPHTPIHIHTPS